MPSIELQIATLLLAAVAAVVSILTYFLAVRNQALPLRQELYKRQADGYSEVMKSVRDFDHQVFLELDCLADPQRGLEWPQIVEKRQDASRILRKVLAMHSMFLPDAFITSVRKLLEMVSIPRDAGEGPAARSKVVAAFKAEIEQHEDAIVNTARMGMMTKGLTQANRKLVADSEMQEVPLQVEGEKNPTADAT